MSVFEGIGFSRPPPSRASIRFGHIDGPILSMRNYGHRWLSPIDRIKLFLGMTNADQLERKYWDKPDYYGG